MKKSFKVLVSVILCFTLLSCIPVMSFADDSTASLYNVYGDGMLFKQNDDAVLAGTGTAGATVSCSLEDENGTELLNSSSVIDSNGKFKLSFTTPAGGYKEYKIKLFVDGNEFCTLNRVVFGELWLASGQSNMQYSLNQSDTYTEGMTGSEWLRFLYIHPYPSYNGNENDFPLEAQDDIEEGYCYWLDGKDGRLPGISAVSFFFAQELQKELDMPVGVLMPNLGGSMLASWLSREAIDSDPVFADYLKTKGLYVTAESWDSSAVEWYSTMTSNYNKKIQPLCNFSIAGMIWYQGESEILTTWEVGYYKRGLYLLQNSYSELFGCDGKLPFIATQVAPFAYGDNKYNLHNNEFVEFQTEDPSSRAVTTIYDLSLNYLPAAGSIHPGAKEPIGIRMAACADGLVYGNTDCYTAATVESSYADGSDFYVTLRDTGEGLKASSDELHGFALCDNGGVYVQANAEIIDENTIKIYCDEVTAPVSASYAFAENNNNANVYSSVDGELFMPVAPFCTDIAHAKLFWEDPAWASCDSDTAFFLTGNEYCGYKAPWTAENAELTTDTASPFAGVGCLTVTSDADSKEFSISPTYTYVNSDNKEKYYDHMLRDWSYYETLTVMVRNNGTNAVELEEMRIDTDGVAWYAPEVNNSDTASFTVPADGQWHKITFDLERLYQYGNESGAQYTRVKLDKIDGFKLSFKGTDGQSANISVDDFRFTADATEGDKPNYSTIIGQLNKFIKLLSELFAFFDKMFISL